MWPELQAARQPKSAPKESHGREALRVPPLRLLLLAAVGPALPPTQGLCGRQLVLRPVRGYLVLEGLALGGGGGGGDDGG